MIVTDAYTAVFLPRQRRAELAGILAQTGRRRPLTWLSLIRWSRWARRAGRACRSLPNPSAMHSGYHQGGVSRRTGRPHIAEAGDGSRPDRPRSRVSGELPERVSR